MERYPDQIMIRISERLKQRLKEDGEEIDRSMSYVARQILEKHYKLGKEEVLNSEEN